MYSKESIACVNIPVVRHKTLILDFYTNRFRTINLVGHLFSSKTKVLKAGVCRPCDTIELTATSCNFSLCRRVEKVCADRQLLRDS